MPMKTTIKIRMEPQPKMVVFVVDDNKVALETLANDLLNCPEIEAVHTFESYAEATLPLFEEQPDVIFLDIEMPGKSGLEFLNSVRPRITFTFKVVFYTAFSHYMLDAIRQSAFDFLLKPYKQSELRLVIDRLMAEDCGSTNFHNKHLYAMPRKIAVQTTSEMLFITPEEILFFNYSSIHRSWIITLTDKTDHILKKNMNAQELLALHPTLARVNNTCVVNLMYLMAVENNTQRCRLCPPFDSIEITISRRYFGKLREHFDVL